MECVDKLTELRTLLAAQDRDSLIGKKTFLHHQRGDAQKARLRKRV